MATAKKAPAKKATPAKKTVAPAAPAKAAAPAKKTAAKAPAVRAPKAGDRGEAMLRSGQKIRVKVTAVHEKVNGVWLEVIGIGNVSAGRTATVRASAFVRDKK